MGFHAKSIRSWLGLETFLLPRVFWISFVFFLSVQLLWLSSGWWDPIVYSLNGKWFCGEQLYFEFLRPPFPGFMNCLFGAGPLAPLASVVFSSTLYFLATALLFRSLSKKEKLDPVLFSIFSFLFPTILIHSNAGGDIFALAFLIFSLTVSLPLVSGAFFGLSTLARYNYLFFLPFLLYHHRKSLPSFIVSFITLWIPWAWYNYTVTGNPFFSISDSYHLNISQKGLGAMPEIVLVLTMGAYLLILLLSRKKVLHEPMLNGIGILAIVQIALSGIKEMRFLLPTVPSQAQLVSNSHHSHSKFIWGLAFFSLLVSLLGVLAFTPSLVGVPTSPLVKECRVLSDKWVYFYPKGIVAEPLPGVFDYPLFLEQGSKLVIYEKSLVSLELRSKYLAEETPEYFILSSPSACEVQPRSFVLKVWRGN